jgi:DNA-binding response OmpR family regulator
MKKVLFLDDHAFWSGEIIEYLRDDKGLEVHAAQSYSEAEALLKKEGHFDMSILDVILQNGKTGLLLAENYKSQLGRIIFITGCNDQSTKIALENYEHVHKLDNIWDTLENFINR